MTFLVVDDSKTLRKTIINSLKRFDLVHVIEAENGKQALQKLLNHEVDFIVTDWNMPEMSGLEFVKAVKQIKEYRNLPILMVTSRGVKDDIIDAMKVGVNSYIVKPFTALILKEKIEEVLKKH